MSNDVIEQAAEAAHNAWREHCLETNPYASTIGLLVWEHASPGRREEVRVMIRAAAGLLAKPAPSREAHSDRKRREAANDCNCWGNPEWCTSEPTCNAPSREDKPEWTPAENCYCGGPEEIYPHRHGTGRFCRPAQPDTEDAA